MTEERPNPGDGKVEVDEDWQRDCLGCERPKNDATWIHHDGLYESYYCDECIDLEGAGKQLKVVRQGIDNAR